jgi:hypothetical protein
VACLRSSSARCSPATQFPERQRNTLAVGAFDEGGSREINGPQTGGRFGPAPSMCSRSGAVWTQQAYIKANADQGDSPARPWR